MRVTLFIIASLLFSVGIKAQPLNVLISDINLPNEPSITIDPKNPAHLMAGSNLDNYFYSADTGKTWQQGYISSDTSGVWGDPCLVVDTAGVFYYFHLSNPVNGLWIDRIVCQRKSFNDANWDDGTYTGRFDSTQQDKHWAVVDRKTNYVYVTWTRFDHYGTSNPMDSSNIWFSVSQDGGATWATPKRINEVAGNCVDGDTTVEGAVPAVGPNGEVYAAWSGPVGIRFDRSLDGGNTWIDHDFLVNEQPTGWNYNISGLGRANGMPITLCDLSNGPYRGNIYVNWSDQRNGPNDADIWLAKSTDGGNTWSNAIRVNNDDAGHQQFLTWMAIDQSTGYLYCVFYDRRHYNDDQTDVYLAVSKDGGETFINYRISDSPFTPNEAVFFGDYTNISVTNGIVRPIWARMDNGQLSMWTAIINANVLDTLTSVAATEEHMPFTLEQNMPNPFSGSTKFSFKLRKPSVVTVKVMDIYGREVALLVDNESRQAGGYIEDFNAATLGLPGGIYYLVMTSGNSYKVRKLVYTR